jgi:hypothetical protein
MFDDLISDLGHVSLLVPMVGLVVDQVRLGGKSKNVAPVAVEINMAWSLWPFVPRGRRGALARTFDPHPVIEGNPLDGRAWRRSLVTRPDKVAPG